MRGLSSILLLLHSKFNIISSIIQERTFHMRFIENYIEIAFLAKQKVSLFMQRWFGCHFITLLNIKVVDQFLRSI